MFIQLRHWPHVPYWVAALHLAHYFFPAGEISLVLLRTELEGLRLLVHTVQYGYALQMIARFAQDASTLLLSLLDGDANTYHLSASLSHYVDEGKACLTIGKEIIDN